MAAARDAAQRGPAAGANAWLEATKETAIVLEVLSAAACERSGRVVVGAAGRLLVFRVWIVPPQLPPLSPSRANAWPCERVHRLHRCEVRSGESVQPLRVVGVATDGAGGEQGEHESWLSTEAGARDEGRALGDPETRGTPESSVTYPPSPIPRA